MAGMNHVEVTADEYNGAFPITEFPDFGCNFRARIALIIRFHHDLLIFILMMKGSYSNDTTSGYGAVSDAIDSLVYLIKRKGIGNQVF